MSSNDDYDHSDTSTEKNEEEEKTSLEASAEIYNGEQEFEESNEEKGEEESEALAEMVEEKGEEESGESLTADDELTEEEKEGLCRAFILLDKDGDGVIDPKDLEQLLITWGRLPFDDELDDIMSYANDEGCEGSIGMNFQSFTEYIKKQLENTRNENELRESFQIFDSKPPTGKVNLTELRHYLKRKGMKLTDDEIDFLFREEDYWMLEDKNIFEYEELISKILDKPTCHSKFLHC